MPPTTSPPAAGNPPPPPKNFSGEPRKRSSHPDLQDLPHHSPPRATHRIRPHPAATTTITTSLTACCHHIYIISTPLTSSPTSPRHYRHTHHPLYQQQPLHRVHLAVVAPRVCWVFTTQGCVWSSIKTQPRVAFELIKPQAGVFGFRQPWVRLVFCDCTRRVRMVCLKHEKGVCFGGLTPKGTFGCKSTTKCALGLSLIQGAFVVVLGNHIGNASRQYSAATHIFGSVTDWYQSTGYRELGGTMASFYLDIMSCSMVSFYILRHCGLHNGLPSLADIGALVWVFAPAGAFGCGSTKGVLGFHNAGVHLVFCDCTRRVRLVYLEPEKGVCFGGSTPKGAFGCKSTTKGALGLSQIQGAFVVVLGSHIGCI
nr:hypothetical protein [Tanacetum cinerariifolium]